MLWTLAASYTKSMYRPKRVFCARKASIPFTSTCFPHNKALFSLIGTCLAYILLQYTSINNSRTSIGVTAMILSRSYVVFAAAELTANSACGPHKARCWTPSESGGRVA